MSLSLVAGLLLPRLLLADTITTTNPYVGVTKIDEVLSSPRPEAIHVLEIDLTAPGIHFEMSPATPPNPPQSGDVTTVQKTLTYMNSVNAQFAINTEFFVNPPHANGGTPLWGFAACNGNVYSPFQATNGNTYAIAPNAAAINIDPANQASVVTRNMNDPTGMTPAQPVTIGNAVSGSARSSPTAKTAFQPTATAEAAGCSAMEAAIPAQIPGTQTTIWPRDPPSGLAKTRRRCSFLPWTTTPTIIARG